MKKLIHTFAACMTLASVALPQVSQARDIHERGVDTFIQVVKSGNFRHFAVCKASHMPESCVRLGNHDWYTMDQLNHQYKVELGQAVLSTTVAAGALILGTLTGMTLYGGATYFAGGAALAGTTGNAVGGVVVAGAAGGTGYLASVARLGPVEQLKQQYLLRDEVINDEDVVLTGKDDAKMREIADRLDTVLKDID